LVGKRIEDSEVYEVVRNLNGDMALGFDGFSSFVFLSYSFFFSFQMCWEVLKEDIMAVFREFHGRGNFEKNLSNS
jgi:hypothetical protein